MVEIHLKRLQGSCAVSTRNATQFAEECQVGVLPSTHAGDLAGTVARVKGSVGSPLIPNSDHALV
jgi:hypothetical protein